MTETIRNDYLSLTVSSLGAEMQSILCGGTEYLWQGDPAFWTGRAPNLFPYVGRMTEKRYTLDGNGYSMRIHGFAPVSEFTAAEKGEDYVVFSLCDSAETLAQYPRRFCFRVEYRLEGKKIRVTYRVENRDEKEMYFGIGAHPGFNVPLEKGLSFEDYQLRFAAEEGETEIGLSDACFLDGTEKPCTLVQRGVLPLRHSLFNRDAIVLRGTGGQVTLFSAKGEKRVTVTYPGMTYLGLWHKPRTEAPYLCLEPWCSLPSTQDRVAAFEEQKDLIRLPAGESYVNEWTIEIG